MIGSALCDSCTAGHAGINIQGYGVPVILVDEEHAVGGGEEMVETGHILAELGGEGEGSLFRALPEGIKHPVEEQAGWGTHLGHIEQLAEKGAKLLESGLSFANPMTYKQLYLRQLVGGEGDCHGDGVELEAEPHHSLSWWRGVMLCLPEAQLF